MSCDLLLLAGSSVDEVDLQPELLMEITEKNMAGCITGTPPFASAQELLRLKGTGEKKKEPEEPPLPGCRPAAPVWLFSVLGAVSVELRG